MKKVLKNFSLCIFALGILCLGFSFGLFEVFADEAFAYSSQIILDNSTFKMSGGTISGTTGDNGGAVYVGNGSTFTMTGGTIKNCTATNGGAVFVANGGTFIFSAGMIENCSAELGYAIYVQSGGTLNYQTNEFGFSNCGETEDLHIYAEEGATVIGPVRDINIYVNGAYTSTIEALGSIYTINEADVPYDYESCCGYFYDAELTQPTYGQVDLSKAKINTFVSKNVIDRKSINIYTRTASAESNFTFTENTTDGTYSIKASSYNVSGDLVLPKEYNNSPVVIADATNSSLGAFYNTNINSVIFPDGLKKIGDYAFWFSKISKVNIPLCVEEIGIGAYGNCENISGQLVIPESITSIPEKAFGNDVNITDISYQGSIYSIGDSAFQGCEGLTDIYIPDDCETIGDYAYLNCYGVKNLTVGVSLENIGTGAFTGINFEQMVVDYSNPYYHSGNGSNILAKYDGNVLVLGCKNSVIPSGIEIIGEYAFYDCSEFNGTIEFPNTLKRIEKYAFFTAGITGVLNLPNGLEYVGENAFASTNIETVNFPDTVTEIGEKAFSGCSSLNTVNLPNSALTIRSYAFEGCGLMNGVAIPETTELIETKAFEGAGMVAFYIPSTVGYVAEMAITTNTSVNSAMAENFTIYTDFSSAQASINAGWDATWYHYGEPTAGDDTLPAHRVVWGGTKDDYQELADGFVINSSGVLELYYGKEENVVVPEGVVEIGYLAFCTWEYHLNLTTVILPSTLTKICTDAFDMGGCPVFIPSTVTTIEANAFYGDYVLYCESSSALSGWAVGWNEYSESPLTVYYGYTLARFKAEQGLTTFVPNKYTASFMNCDISIAKDYHIEAILNKKETAFIEEE